jgi:hypothetical protein
VNAFVLAVVLLLSACSQPTKPVVGLCSTNPLPDWCREMLDTTPPPCLDLRVECQLR